MTYAVESDIEAELKNIDFSAASSQVTSINVSSFITQADALIDMYIGKRYDTPVTNSKALSVIKKIAIDIVVYRIVKILDLSKSIPIPDQQIIQDITEGSAYRESINLLKAIRDDKMDLPGETLLEAGSALQSFHSETVNSNITPVFDKELKQW